MILVPHQQLQCMLAGFERNLGLGLAGAKMQMIKVVRDGLIEGRQMGIDQEMMMTRVFAVGTRRRNAHISQPEIELQLCRDRCSVLEIDEVHLGSGTGRSRTTGSLRLRS